MDGAAAAFFTPAGAAATFFLGACRDVDSDYKLIYASCASNSFPADLDATRVFAPSFKGDNALIVNMPYQMVLRY